MSKRKEKLQKLLSEAGLDQSLVEAVVAAVETDDETRELALQTLDENMQALRLEATRAISVATSQLPAAFKGEIKAAITEVLVESVLATVVDKVTSVATNSVLNQRHMLDMATELFESEDSVRAMKTEKARLTETTNLANGKVESLVEMVKLITSKDRGQAYLDKVADMATATDFAAKMPELKALTEAVDAELQEDDVLVEAEDVLSRGITKPAKETAPEAKKIDPAVAKYL